MSDFKGIYYGSFAYVPRIDIGGIYVLATTGKAVNTTAGEESIDYGINPYQWNALPAEGILLLKVRHAVTESEADYPVSIILPSVQATTVTSNPLSINNTNKVPVVDKHGYQTSGRDITSPTSGGAGAASPIGSYIEHLVYFNKCSGVFRLINEASVNNPNTAAAAGGGGGGDTPTT